MKWSWLSFFSQSCEKWMSGFRFFSARVSVVGNGWTVWCFNTTKSNTKTCAWVSSCFWSLFCLVYIKKNRSHPETRANSHVSLKSHLISTRKHRVNIWSILSCNHGVLTADAYGLKLKLEGLSCDCGFTGSFACLLGKMLLNHEKLH